MSLQLKRASIPFVGGIDTEEGAVLRNAPKLTQAKNVVPVQRGVLRTRDGYNSTTYTGASTDEFFAPYAPAGTSGYVGLQGICRFAGDNAAVLYGGRVRELSGTGVNSDQPRYSEVLWTEEELLPPTPGYGSASQVQVLTWNDQYGHEWRSVARRVLQYTGSTDSYLEIVFFCDGARRYSYALDTGTSGGWRYWSQNAVRCDVHVSSVTGYGDYVLFLIGNDTAHSYSIVRFPADDPSSYTTHSFSPTFTETGEELTCWDVCASDDGSTYWAVAYGTNCGAVRLQRLGSTTAQASAERTIVSAAYTVEQNYAIRAIRCSSGLDQTKTTIGVVYLLDIGTYSAYIAFDNKSSTAGQLLYGGGLDDVNAVDIAPVSIGYNGQTPTFVIGYSRVVRSVDHDSDPWFAWGAYAQNGTSVSTVRTASKIYGVGLASLIAYDEMGVLAALQAPQVPGYCYTRKYPDQLTGYTFGAMASTCVLVEFGRGTEETGPTTHDNATLTGSPLTNQVHSVGSTKFNPASPSRWVPVLTLESARDFTEYAAHASPGASQSLGTVYGIQIHRRVKLDPCRLHDGIVVPGGTPTWYPTQSSAAPVAFGLRPKAVAASGGSGYITAVTYFRVCYEWVNDAGLVVRSEPSDPMTFDPGASSLTAYIDVESYPFAPNAHEVRIVLYESDDGVNYYRVDAGYAQANAVQNNAASYYTRITRGNLEGYPQASNGYRSNTTLYTSGGVLPATLPDSAQQAIHWQRRIWLAGSHRKLYYSREIIPGEMPAWSEALTITIGDQRIVACQPLGERLAIFTTSATYLLSGDGPNDIGQGGFQQPGKLADVGVELLSSHKTASGSSGVWFAGTDGHVWQIGLDGSMTRHDEILPDWLSESSIGGKSGDPITWRIDRIAANLANKQIRVQIGQTQNYPDHTYVWSEEYKVWTEETTPASYCYPADDVFLFTGHLSGYTTGFSVGEQAVGQYYDQTRGTRWAAWTEIPIECTVRLGLTLDGPHGMARLYTVSPLVRISECAKLWTDVYPNGFGSIGRTTVAGVGVQPDTGGFTGASNTGYYGNQFDPLVGGLFGVRLHVGQRLTQFDVELYTQWLGNVPGGPSGQLPSACGPFEAHAIVLEYGIPQGAMGRYPESANG